MWSDLVISQTPAMYKNMFFSLDVASHRCIVLSSVCRWYHGRLDRNVSEDRLRQAKQLGSYLIRESDRKPGSYVLSFFGQKGMNHFRSV